MLSMRLLLISSLLSACFSRPSIEELEQQTFILQGLNDMEIRTSLAIADKTKAQGLSGKRSSDFSQDQGMLFVFPKIGPRRFWMRDTYFNLDIIFLDKDLTVIGMEKNVPHHPGNQTPPPIYTTPIYDAQYVLEIRADSPLGKHIRIGSQFLWDSKPSLEQIIDLI